MLHYQKSKGTRLKKQFTSVQVDGDTWWIPSQNRWTLFGEDIPALVTFQNFSPCRSIRAFRKMLKNNPHIQKKAVLKNKFIGYDVFA